MKFTFFLHFLINIFKSLTVLVVLPQNSFFSLNYIFFHYYPPRFCQFQWEQVKFMNLKNKNKTIFWNIQNLVTIYIIDQQFS